MKLVHAADLHLDSPLRGLDRYDGAPVDQFRDATRVALKNLVQLCLDEKAAMLLLAGDLYDGSWRDYRTGLFFSQQMSRLRAADVQVVLVRGNHDAESTIHRNLPLPDHVVELTAKRPETRRYEKLGLAVHGQSFAQRAVTDDLADRYPAALAGLVNIGLLHTSVTGREGHDSYAPCSLETLRNKGYDYWALGHVHAREELSAEPWIVFPGNLQGRHAREVGTKGATVITVDNLSITSVEPRALDVVRWDHLVVDVEEAEHPDDVAERARAALESAVARADGRLLAARLTIQGRSGAHARIEAEPTAFEARLRALALDVGDGERVWLEKVQLRTSAPLDLAGAAERDDAVGELVRALRGLPRDEALLAQLCEGLRELRDKLPAELKEGPDSLRLDDPAMVAGLADELEQLLLPRLLTSERARHGTGTGTGTATGHGGDNT